MVIDDKFKKQILALKSLWEKIQKECLIKEQDLKAEDRVPFITHLESKYFPEMMKHFAELNRISTSITNEEYPLYKEFARENLCSLMISNNTVLNKQIADKPLGYAGDYIVAKYFYAEGYTGTSLWGMLMDRFTVKSPLATAHRNRRKYLGSIIECLHKNKSNGPLRVTSFACGPAPEVFDSLSKGMSNIEYFLLDGEKDVINYLTQKLTEFDDIAPQVKLQEINIINLLRKNTDLNIPKQDFIYCAGFFDYIKDSTARKLIGYMLRQLNTNGQILIVNVSKDDEHDVCLNMLADWKLIHRNEQDLSCLVDREDVRKEVWADEETKRNIYLKITKV